MFKLDLSKTYYFPVSAEIPQDGKHQKISFDAEFARLTKSETREIFERMPSVNPGKEIDNPINEDELLGKVFVGWKGIQDEAGGQLPVSETARERLLEVQGISLGIINAWFASIAGSQAKQKN